MSTELNVGWIIDSWIPALESGTYKQGRGVLRSSDGFCCLGVAHDVLAKQGKTRGWNESEILTTGVYCALPDTEQQMPDAAYLSVANAAYLGVSLGGVLPNVWVNDLTNDQQMRLRGYRQFVTQDLDDNAEVSLAGLNDAGFSFAEIADVLRLAVKRTIADVVATTPDGVPEEVHDLVAAT